MAGGAASALTNDAQGVGVVHHGAGAVLLGQPHDLRQVGDVAAHGEHTVGDDQDAGSLRHLLELPLQIGHVVVLIAQHLAEAELAAVINAGMVFPVADDVVVAAHQGGDDAQIGQKARRKGHHTVLAQEFGELLFQLQMKLQRAVHEAGAAAAGAILLQRLDAGLDDLGIHGETQIVVGAQHDTALALHDDFHVLTRFQRMEIGVDPHLPIFICEGKSAAFFKNIHFL